MPFNTRHHCLMSASLHSPYKRSHKSPVTEAEEGLSLVSFCSKTSPFLTVAPFLPWSETKSSHKYFSTTLRFFRNVDFKLQSRKKHRCNSQKLPCDVEDSEFQPIAPKIPWKIPGDLAIALPKSQGRKKNPLHPKNHGISKLWELEIPEPCKKQVQVPLFWRV